MNKIYRLAFFLIILRLSGGSAAAGQAGTTEAKNLQELVARAKDSNHVVTLSLEATDAEIIRAKEQAFEKRFGFPG